MASEGNPSGRRMQTGRSMAGAKAPTVEEDPPELLDDEEVEEIGEEDVQEIAEEDAPSDDGEAPLAEDEEDDEGDLLRAAGAESGEDRAASEPEPEPTDPLAEEVSPPEAEATDDLDEAAAGGGASTLEEPLNDSGGEEDADFGDAASDPEREPAPMFDDEDTDHRRDFSEEERTPPQAETATDEPPPWQEPEEPTGRQAPDVRRRRRRRAVDTIEEEESTASGRDGSEEAEPWNHSDADSEGTAVTEEPEEVEEADKSEEPDEPPSDVSVFPDSGPTRVEVAFQPAPSGALLSEKTQILGQAAAEAPPAAYLVIVKGEEEGREIELSGRAFNMGRGADNDLVFPDIACSRRHAVIENDGDGYTVTDLGSGNGTLVNSKRVQKARLADGDRIEIGNTILEFHDPAASARAGTAPRAVPEGTVTASRPLPEPASGPVGAFLAGVMADPRKKRLFWIVSGVFGLLFLLVLIKIVIGPGQPAGPTPDEIARAEQARANQELNDHLTQAKLLVRDKKWQEAGLRINMALKIDPQNNVALDYQKTIRRELQCEQSLATVRSFVEQRAWEQALRVVGAISSDCEQFEQAQEIRPQIENGMLEDLLQQGQEMMRNKEFAQAVLKFDEVLRRRPDHTEAQLLKKQAEGEIEREAARLARAHAPRTVSRPAQPKPDSGGALSGQVLAFYRNGELDKAIDKAEANGSPQVAKLRKFQALYQRGKELARQHGEISQAIKALEGAIALDREIGGGSGKLRDELASLLAKSHFLRGMDAFSARNYPDAYRSFTTALKYQPDYKLAQERLADLEKQAKKLFEEAYVIKSTNAEDAIKKLNIVMQIIPADHLYYKKAKTLKASISGGDEGGGGGDSGF